MKYSFILSKSVSDTKKIVSIINRNKATTGLHKNASLFQKREVQQWFNEKDKVKICFLPTSKEDETTNIGCATVFFEILQNAGLISIHIPNTERKLMVKIKIKIN